MSKNVLRVNNLLYLSKIYFTCHNVGTFLIKILDNGVSLHSKYDRFDTTAAPL